MSNPLTRASADLIEADLTLGLGCHVQLDTERNKRDLDSTRPVGTRHGTPLYAGTTQLQGNSLRMPRSMPFFNMFSLTFHGSFAYYSLPPLPRNDKQLVSEGHRTLAPTGQPR